jgi:hypothetical protein
MNKENWLVGCGWVLMNLQPSISGRSTASMLLAPTGSLILSTIPPPLTHNTNLEKGISKGEGEFYIRKGAKNIFDGGCLSHTEQRSSCLVGFSWSVVGYSLNAVGLCKNTSGCEVCVHT